MVSYRRMVPSTLKSCEDLQDILEEGGVEDWRQIISNPVIKLLDSVNADETTMTMATMTVQEFYQWKVEIVKWVVLVTERQMRRPLVPAFDEAVWSS